MLRHLTACCVLLLSSCAASTGSLMTTTKQKNNYGPEPVHCSLQIAGFSLSDTVNGPRSGISWNEVDMRYLHISVIAQVADSVSALEGRYQLLNGKEPIQRASSSTRESGGYFDVVISRGALDPNQSYMIWVSDNFDNPLCVAANSIRTLPAIAH